MGRSSPTAGISETDLGFSAAWRGTLPTKRASHGENPRNLSGDALRPVDRHGKPRHQPRKGLPFRMSLLFYAAVAAGFIVLLILATFQLSSVNEGVGHRGGKGLRGGKGVGSVLRFVPVDLWRRFEEQGGLDRLRAERRYGIRPPRLAVVLGGMKRDAQSLMLLTVVKSLRELGYMITVFARRDGEGHSLWEHVGCQVSILGSETTGYVDWSNFEGVILSSLEGKEAISSLMQEPFNSVPLIWLVQEDILGKRLSLYAELGWRNLITEWRSAFSRADVVVFPDFSLPLLYTSLDTGNFFVISGSPVDVWAARSYITSHSRYQLRKDNGFDDDDLLILVIGSYFFYDELPWDYAAAMQALAPEFMKLTRIKELGGSFKFVFLCGNSTHAHGTAFQEIASRLGLPDGSVRHYGMDGDVNSVLLMADIVLYGSFQEEQSFPPILVRAMSFAIPIVAPDLSIIKKYVVDKVHGFIFSARNPESLTSAFSLLISDKHLSKLAYTVASYGKLLAKNMLASDCIAGYAKLLENVLQFPSDVMLPGSISQLQQNTWVWNFFDEEIEQTGREVQAQLKNFDNNGYTMLESSIIFSLENEEAGKTFMGNTSQDEVETITQDYPTQLDWDDLRETEISEDYESREIEELEERMERTLGSWEDIYRNARKAEKLKSEGNERDEGELERTGQPLCIYEIYSGEGAWPILHHGSLYRGISLSKRARRSRSDDVDAVDRLPILNDTYYKDLLCEHGAMFAVANRVDSIHKIPWIGFQSWRAAGKKVSLSTKAEKVLEETIQAETKGDIIYYWARMDMDHKNLGRNENSSFWSVCDILNGGHCRAAFEDSFRQMYGLPHGIAALPPMPDDGDQWSTLHSWVMPTPSFLEFVMFSRMFADSLDSLNSDVRSPNSCLLGSSKLERRHCYCRVLELLVNVWAYHSARKMVYLNPSTGELKEQHPIEQREGLMWVKYFNFTLLKSMDEDLAEEADDGLHPNERWLWPLTGEVHWQGVYDREREQRYRQKMDKKLKTMEKLLDRQKHGYKQKSLGG